ncbi:Cas1p-domain-containing protein [Exidia glandulosa HHB12029]|uniref:Cas1p-domain-containing protein n=1 Tax=Exidia glandulosa HHB12029 TaxID=1314781 RepID=A0A165PQN1_EXIGL|nr:Cas1p-domain-containing protein [Exidia glandulosa HHB12029]
MANSRKPSFSLDPLWPHYGSAGIIAVTFVLGVLRLLLLDWTDPQHCGALLTTGQWLDSSFKNWQPEGCMVHQYKAKDVETCMKYGRVVFVGDSVTRQLFFALAHIADPSLPQGPPSSDQKHSDYAYDTKSGVHLNFIWDPFLNTSKTATILQGNVDFTPATAPDTQPPTLLVMGSGLWYLRYSADTGGLPTWTSMIETTFAKISNAKKPIAQRLVFLPVEQVVESQLSEVRAASIHPADIEAMNSDLSHRISPPTTTIWNGDGVLAGGSTKGAPLPIALPMAFNLMLDPSQSKDGMHFSANLVQAQANVLLNLRCNEELPKVFPLDKTCCRSYPTPSYLQLAVLAVIVLWGPIARLGRPFLDRNPIAAKFFPGADYAMSMSIFGLAIGVVFFADRTGIWLKEQKAYDPWVFAFLSLAALGVGLGTMKSADKDLGFLNREQTDEWKGWMQLAILIYHYLGASKISGIYNPIRALVAAYLFMTGYGHTTFYLKKADFGFLRIAQVMVRLNLLTIALAYTMNTDYISYYFAPLVSWWFCIIYVTLIVGKQYNTNVYFVLVKIAISMALVTWFMRTPWILEELFALLNQFCRIKWSAKEWNFRVSLDLWIVYFGMLAAIAYIKFRELRLGDHPQWPMVQKVSLVLSGLVMLWYFAFELSQPDKFTYNAWHPYVAIFPVMAFVGLRNANAKLRGASSRMFAFIGTCSLETFILQYHIWLAADTKGILLVIPGTRWRPVNMVLSTIMFVYLSYKVANATGDLTTWVCGSKKGGALPTAAAPPAAAARPAASATAEEAIPLASRVDGEAPKPANGERWVDRLANGSSAPSGPGFRMFKESGPLGNVSFGLPAKLGVSLAVLWILNMFWPTSP